MFINNMIWNCKATQINDYFTSEWTLMSIHETHPNVFIISKRSLLKKSNTIVLGFQDFVTNYWQSNTLSNFLKKALNTCTSFYLAI